jgi:hypothetical protein
VADGGVVEALGDVPGNINPASRTVQTLVSLMHGAISQEHALSGVESELVIVIGVQIWLARAAKCMKENVPECFMK